MAEMPYYICTCIDIFAPDSHVSDRKRRVVLVLVTFASPVILHTVPTLTAIEYPSLPRLVLCPPPLSSRCPSVVQASAEFPPILNRTTPTAASSFRSPG